MKDQTRNLNPTQEAKVAMIIWGEEYSKQRGGSMDFWDTLSSDKKRRCGFVIKEFLSSQVSEEEIQNLINQHTFKFCDNTLTNHYKEGISDILKHLKEQ